VQDNVWVRQFLLATDEKLKVLCCPEDIVSCDQHEPNIICSGCKLPICSECFACLANGNSYGSPMALCNDNFWGFLSSFIVKYEVRFIETLVATPIWTTTSVFYVEGDRGHLLNEGFGQKRYRTAMRGYVNSFVMPWEDILHQLGDTVSEAEMRSLPRSPACLGYLIRFTLTNELGPLLGHCRSLMVRPGVVLLLIFELIRMGHETFRGQGEAHDLRQAIEAAMAEYYPETEANVPLEQRQGHIPHGNLAAVNASKYPCVSPDRSVIQPMHLSSLV